MRDACIVGKTFLAPRQLCGGVGGRNQVDPYRSKRAERMAHGGVRKDQSSSFLLYSAPFLLFVLACYERALAFCTWRENAAYHALYL